MPETAEAPVVVEPQTPVDPVVDPVPAPSLTEGETQEPDARSGLAEILKSATPDEIEQLLANAPAEAREAYEKKLESRGEQRAQTRKRETDTAKTDRLAAWKPYVDNLATAQNYVNTQLAKLKAGDFIDDPKLFEQATQQLNVGTLGKVVLENEQYVAGLVDKYLPEMTAEEAQTLDKPLYKFGQTGMAKEAVHAIFEVAVERAKAEAFEQGVKKGEGNLAARESLLEKLSKTQKIKNEGAGISPKGHTSTDPRNALVREMKSIDVTTPEGYAEWQKKSEGFKRAINGG